MGLLYNLPGRGGLIEHSLQWGISIGLPEGKEVERVLDRRTREGEYMSRALGINLSKKEYRRSRTLTRSLTRARGASNHPGELDVRY